MDRSPCFGAQTFWVLGPFQQVTWCQVPARVSLPSRLHVLSLRVPDCWPDSCEGCQPGGGAPLHTGIHLPLHLPVPHRPPACSPQNTASKRTKGYRVARDPSMSRATVTTSSSGCRRNSCLHPRSTRMCGPLTQPCTNTNPSGGGDTGCPAAEWDTDLHLLA